MGLFLQEFKKLFRPGYLAIAVICFLFWGFFTSYRFFPEMSSQAHTDSYPEDIPMDAHYSMELLFKDTLLKEYGPTLEKSELPRLSEQYEHLSSQIRRAAESDEILTKNGGYLSDDFMLNGPTITENGTDDVPQFSESEQEYRNRFINGQLQLPGTDAPVYFVQQLYRLLPQLEKAAQNLSDSETVYTILSTTLVSNLIDCLYPIFLAGMCSLFLIVPYAILENQRGTVSLLYSSRRGMRIEHLRLWSIAVCALMFLAVGLFFSAVMFGSWDVERYYDSLINGVMMEIKFNALYDNFGREPDAQLLQQSAYSGMTFLQLYINLCAALVPAIISIVLITGTILSHMRNIIASFTAAVPFAILGYTFFTRYVEKAINNTPGYIISGNSHWYLFYCRNEVWVTAIALLGIACTGIGLHLYITRKRTL